MFGTGKLSEEVLVTAYAVVVEGPADVAWVNAEETTSFMVVAIRTVGTGALDDFRILGNPQANGGGTDVVLAGQHADIATANAVGDWLMLEVTEADLAAQAENPILGLSASLGHVVATDDTAVTYIQRKRKQQADLTASSVIS